MSGISDLLRDLFERIGGFWPIRIIQDWEQGLRVRAGRITASLSSENGLFGTGVHFFWPLIGEIYKDETNIRLAITDRQDLTLADGRSVTFSFGVRYRVRDLALCWRKVQTYEGAILDAVMCAAGRVVERAGIDAFGPAVEAAARAEIRGWGLEILSLTVVNLSFAAPYRVILDGERRQLVADAGLK